eukprot:GHRQ01024939.1.p2 GENE.GHRQ01024939.1~~GHRQ01024939.1.p2  ORF type:complete len:126 (+),score=0.49 GHRQ01024939.1:509-886(+)
MCYLCVHIKASVCQELLHVPASCRGTWAGRMAAESCRIRNQVPGFLITSFLMLSLSSFAGAVLTKYTVFRLNFAGGLIACKQHRSWWPQVRKVHAALSSCCSALLSLSVHACAYAYAVMTCSLGC